MSESDRAPTKMDLLLSLLSDGQWHSTDQLIEEVGHRFSATVHLARQAGHKIERRRDGFDNEWRLLTVTETPGLYNLGNSESELQRDKVRRKVTAAFNKLERQGVTWPDILETMSAIASAKGWANRAAILENAAKVCR